MTARRDGCPDNLLARSLVGGLSPVEQRAVAAHLGVCSSCRATMALREAYRQMPDSPSSDDRAVVARLAGAITLNGRHRRASARLGAFAAGAALMAMAGAAAAWVVLQRTPPANPPTKAPQPRSSIPPVVQALTPPPSLDSAAAVAPPGSVPPTANKRALEPRHVRAVAADARDRLVSDRSGGGTGPSDDAAELFAAANVARGTGDLRVAARRYDLLERRYPHSPEAAVSLVSAGDLLMRLGEPSAALAHFDQYLRANGRGPLALEALFGRARSLRDLGRSGDELQTWQELLRTFPSSLYEAAARHRVAELSR